MKKVFILLATLLASVSIHAAQFNEGDHYQVLDVNKSSSPVVTEFFSFYCPHCLKFEPFINELKKKIPDNAKLQKVHVSFMGGNMAVPVAKAYATMVVLKVEETMVPYFFKQIQILQNAPQSEADIRQMFIDNGIDGKKFDSAYNGFAVDSIQKRFDKQFTSTGLQGVPGVVVNNKYLVKTDKLKGYDDYFDLVNFLLKK
ncbi:thiol:disulfide interchange protein DsbA [Vibrio sp. MACH09]|uniref:thiol:disulfide interchange protein DsbA/DsbL n=1 Tax=unclassified Vibrio TaxID=2614977 RepID=UPI0014935B3C|nr:MULTISPECIES: thiol:disulfide interchange protein DsbA/DsbL [unclassified Vibrio]NOI68417.1 thiol:disulfide interchange protein DsbA/DsbL [Vibrio sp. 99-8-1]GLO62381.1 thiol:disulfide interchange protein DsbA [Vibrio sp. MACH09]